MNDRWRSGARPTASRPGSAPCNAVRWSGWTTAASCEHPLDRNLALAQRLGVQGTPTLVWADGSRTDGYVDRGVLQARLKQLGEGRP